MSIFGNTDISNPFQRPVSEKSIIKFYYFLNENCKSCALTNSNLSGIEFENSIASNFISEKKKEGKSEYIYFFSFLSHNFVSALNQSAFFRIKFYWSD